MPDSPEARKAPGILYYDPNPTTAKLATASLRLAGYQVYNATGQKDAVSLFKMHGAGGDNSIVALLLDASADPAVSASVLRELVRLPGAGDIPGILIVSRRNPNPIPAAAGLPTVRRPFSSPALLKVVSETVASLDAAKLPPDMDDVPDQRKVQLARLLSKHFPGLGKLEQLDMAAVESLFQELEGTEELPSPPGEQAIRVDLAAQRLESLLEMLSDDSVTGVLSISSDGREARLHLAGGQIRLAEYFGDDEDLKLGRFVVEGGFMRDDELEAFIVGRDPAGRPLGQRLVEAGFITPSELAAAILAQAREITCHVLTFRKGVAGFVPLAKLEAVTDDNKVELPVSEALLDGLRRLDENALMGPQMPELDDVYVRDDARVSRMAREILARDELDVLELINGRNSVKDIARRTRTGTFAVSRIVYRLAKSNVVRRRVTPVTV
jgi:CheY-like chemotaxis protein